jgi:hypothetical protein
MSIDVIFTAENRKYCTLCMHVGFAINVIQSAKYPKYMHIEIASCSSRTHKNTFGVIIPPTTQRLSVFAGITICFIKSFIKIINHRGRRKYFHICIIITIIIIIIHLLSSLANFFCYNHHLILSSPSSPHHI